AGEPQTTTDAGGNFAFNGLAPGTYRVRDILPSGWTHTNPTRGFFDVAVEEFQTGVAPFATTFADGDDSISEVNQQSSHQLGVGKSVNFTIGNPSDADLVSFTAQKGQRIGFNVDRANGSSLNSFLRLFDATGKELASNDNGAAPGETKGS